MSADLIEAGVEPINGFNAGLLKEQLEKITSAAKKSAVQLRLTPPGISMRDVIDVYQNRLDLSDKTCFSPWSMAVLSAYGDVFPCSNYAVGNIRNEPFLKLWNNELMMKFRITVRKEGMPDEERIVEAPSRFVLYEHIQKEGGTVVELDEVSRRFELPSWLSITIGSGVKRAEMIQMTKNLSTMLAAGLSISRALSVIERQTGDKRLKAIASGLSDSVKKGSSFHEALALYPKVFPGIFVAMTRSGEESGSLADALSIVGLQMERSEELVRKIKGAMIYPAIVVSAIIIVGVLMLIYVVPTLTKTFTELGVQVPLATRIIVALSDFMVAHTVLVLGMLIALTIGGAGFIRSKPGSAFTIACALRLPVIGELVRETHTARAARTLSSLLSSGVPVLDALAITKEVVHARAFAKVIEEAEVRVKKGETLSSSFAEHAKLYPILMSEMVAVGEETGKVAEMLKQVAEFYEGDVAEKTRDLSAVIEPMLILVIGACVGVFAVSMIAPIYSLSSAF